MGVFKRYPVNTLRRGVPGVERQPPRGDYNQRGGYCIAGAGRGRNQKSIRKTMLTSLLAGKLEGQRQEREGDAIRKWSGRGPTIRGIRNNKKMGEGRKIDATGMGGGQRDPTTVNCRTR